MSLSHRTADESAAPRGGVALLVVGLAFAALSGAQMKQLAETLPVLLIVWFRFTGYFLIMAPIALMRKGRSALRPARPLVQVLRGLMLVGSTVCFITGARSMDYAEAIAVLYAYPFLIAFLAPLLLGERARPATWIGVGGGFLGVLLVVRPSLEGLANPGAVWVLGCAALVSMQMILNRKLGSVSDPIMTSVYGALVASLAASVVVAEYWRPIGERELLLLVAIAALAALSQTMMAFAYARSPAADLAPFSYTELLAAVAFGWLYFDTLPDLISWVGMAVIVASGVLVARVHRGRLTFRRQTKI